MTYLKKVTIQGTNDAGTLVDIPVTSEGHMEVALHAPRLPFGEVSVESLTPIFQTDAVYGLNSTETRTSTDGTGGTATAANNLFTVGTGGATAGYFGSIQSRRRLRYRPGQGVVARFTGLYSTPAANVVQVIGIGTAESGYYFGYDGTNGFGILHNYGGKRAIHTLTVSVGAGGSENVTVELNGVSTVVAVVSGNATSTAYQLSQGTYSGWTCEQRGATVVFLSNAVGAKAGAFSLASTGTAAGTFATTLAGTAATDNWVYQSAWNGDKLNGTGASGVTLVPTYGNVFAINAQYLGYGAVVFQVEVCDSGGNNADFVTVHTLRFPNSQTATNITQPSFPFTMSCANVGAGASKTVSCASFAGFIAGRKVLIGPRMSYQNTATSSTSAFVPLFTIRNSLTFGGRANQAVVNVLSMSGAAKSTNGITTFYLLRNATLSAGIPNYTQYATTSVTHWDTAATACTIATNDQQVWSGTVSESGQLTFAFSDEILLQPGETMTLAVRSVTATAVCVGQINTREDQ